jgi:hypothetical protein
MYGSNALVFWNRFETDSQGAFVRARLSRLGEVLEIVPIDTATEGTVSLASVDGAIAVGYSISRRQADGSAYYSGHVKLLEGDQLQPRWEKQYPGYVESVAGSGGGLAVAWSELRGGMTLELIEGGGNRVASIDLWPPAGSGAPRPIHAQMAGSEDGVWVAWHGSEGGNDSVWLARFGHDGSTVLPPHPVGIGSDARIAATTGVAAVAWSEVKSSAVQPYCYSELGYALLDPAGAIVANASLPGVLVHGVIAPAPNGFSVAATAVKSVFDPDSFGGEVFIGCSTPIAIQIDLQGQVLSCWLPWPAALQRDGGHD